MAISFPPLGNQMLDLIGAADVRGDRTFSDLVDQAEAMASGPAAGLTLFDEWLVGAVNYANDQSYRFWLTQLHAPGYPRLSDLDDVPTHSLGGKCAPGRSRHSQACRPLRRVRVRFGESLRSRRQGVNHDRSGKPVGSPCLPNVGGLASGRRSVARNEHSGPRPGVSVMATRRPEVAGLLRRVGLLGGT